MQLSKDAVHHILHELAYNLRIQLSDQRCANAIFRYLEDWWMTIRESIRLVQFEQEGAQG